MILIIMTRAYLGEENFRLVRESEEETNHFCKYLINLCHRKAIFNYFNNNHQ